MTGNAPLDSPLLATSTHRLDDGLVASIGYGKAAVVVYRTATPAQLGVVPVPESPFTGRRGQLLAAEIGVETTGDAFLPSWTDGDNRALVATDTMKNFVQYQASCFGGTTVEGLAGFVGEAMLVHYPDMARLRVTAQHLPFAEVPGSGVTFRRLGAGEPGVRTTVALERGADATPVAVSVVCGLDGLRLVRLTGSSFTGFPRDEFTTLPDDGDRPLEMGLHLRWTYADPADALADDLRRWVPAEQVLDVVASVVDAKPGRSIQQTLTDLGRSVLERFGPIGRVWFEAENRVWSAPRVLPADGAVVHTAALPSHGVLRLELARPGAA